MNDILVMEVIGGKLVEPSAVDLLTIGLCQPRTGANLQIGHRKEDFEKIEENQTV